HHDFIHCQFCLPIKIFPGQFESGFILSCFRLGDSHQPVMDFMFYVLFFHPSLPVAMSQTLKSSLISVMGA
ncbi:MAG TPA: hypothetical protein QF683_04335, partial [SAR324 cluster bacterium]|nr:hypothetical protein [SAR324 cluster bacterium]